MRSEFGLSIIVPVLHEGHSINPFIDHLKQFKKGYALEIIVVDGSDDSSTNKNIIDPAVIKLNSPRRGRGIQMNFGAATARYPNLLFLHADVRLPQNAVALICKCLETQGCVAGAFQIRFDSESLLLKLIALRSNLRCRLTRIPYGDQGIFIRKGYFENIGGFGDFIFLEDVDLMRRIKRNKSDIHIISEKITTSSRRWEKEGILFCTLRNQLVVTLFHFGVHPNKLANFYKQVKY
ncbi:MAG: hypothetical protein A2Y07_06720 [Planctomycetes bacterium GWF2_50_10]|nr:MAG: hypothetical protein A2Y07_06720 [Planctomycetes bacterium GWF2_50_10]